MGLKYCQKCKTGFPSSKTVFYKGQFFCTKCKVPTVDMGEEEEIAQLSEDARGSSPQYEEKTLSKVGVIYKGKQVDTTSLQIEDYVTHQPDNPDALFTQALHLYTSGEYGKAKQLAERVLQLAPDHSKAQRFLTEKFEDEKASDILKNDPHNIEGLFSLAQVYLRKNQTADAKALLLRVVSAQPRHLGGRRLLSELALLEEDYQTAVTHLGFLKLLRPDDVYVFYNLGIACHYAGNPNRALSAFKEALSLSEDPELSEEIQDLIKQINPLLK